MGKQQLIVTFLLFLLVSIVSSSGIVFAQVLEIDDDVKEPIKDEENNEIKCGAGTIRDGDTCKSICMDGTVLIGDTCKTPEPLLGGSDNDWIGWGVLIAAIIAGFGILFTYIQQRIESQKRTHEIIQTYSSKITEITNKESTLKTKQDCALYAEQYLDTLEEIATLARAGNFNKGIISHSYKHVTEYFNNNFAYGYDLWWWYHKYIHGFNDDTMQDRLWKVTKGSNTERESTIETLFNQDEISVMSEKEKQAKADALNNFLRDDRWPDFRTLCRENNITEFTYNYKGLGAFDSSEKHWRVLPDLMYYDYEQIPDEDGLTKAEFVDIIRSYANDLSNFVEKEKKMSTSEDFEVYAEQYLETLEQIATLFRNKIIPTKGAASYFENKFSYGCNLWEWYYQIVLKFSPNFYHALWAMNDKKIEKDKEAQIKTDNFSEFLNFYSNKNPAQAVKQFKNEDPDVLKLIAKISVKNKLGKISDAKINQFLKQQVQVMTDEQIIDHLKEFVNNFSANERWRDFRWWCKDDTIKDKITPFDEDFEEGLILPLRMWKAKYN